MLISHRQLDSQSEAQACAGGSMHVRTVLQARANIAFLPAVFGSSRFWFNLDSAKGHTFTSSHSARPAEVIVCLST